MLREAAFVVPAVAAVSAGVATMANDRRIKVMMLAIAYVCEAWLLGMVFPMRLVAVKLAVGGIVCGILLMTAREASNRFAGESHEAIPQGRTFRGIAALLIVVTIFSLGATGWRIDLAIAPVTSLGAAVLMGLGLLQLGISNEPFRVGIGLLTTLCGFEIVYGNLEPSLAVQALLGAVNIVLALVVSFMILGIEIAPEEAT